MENFTNNVWAPIVTLLNLTHSTLYNPYACLINNFLIILNFLNLWTLICMRCMGMREGEARTANCSNPNNPKDGHKRHFKVSRFCNFCKMDQDDYRRSRKSYVTHPQECFDEGGHRSVLFYSLSIGWVNLKSAPLTTVKEELFVWVKTLRDLQAWKTDEDWTRISTPSFPPPPQMPAFTPSLLPRYMYQSLLYLSIAFNLLFQTFLCGKINSACLLYVNNNSYAINLLKMPLYFLFCFLCSNICFHLV